MLSALDVLLSDSLYKEASFSECVDMLTYEMLFESSHIDPKNSYEINVSGRGFWTFDGKTKVKHFIRIIKGAKERWELKIGFFDGKKPVYDKPNLYFNDDVYQYDPSVLNTYIKAFNENVVPYFFEQIPNGELDFPATDRSRYRLYKLMMHRFLDTAKYEVVNDDGQKRFTIKKKRDG
jgi:hypothetical protein